MNIIKSIPCLVSLCFFSQVQASVQSHFEYIKKDPNALYEFLKAMPKGGELHYHLAGGAYPEMMLEVAAQNDYCLNTKTFALSAGSSTCDGISTKDILNQPEIYSQTIRSWSMQNFVAGSESGHDHFFNTFGKFIPLVSDHSPELITDVIARAANQNEQYLELMILPDNGKSMSFGALVKDASSLAQKRQILLANKEFQQNINFTVDETERQLKEARQKSECESKPQSERCQLSVKFLYYTLREQPLDSLFAQTLNAFEAVTKSQNKGGSLVGVNLVQAEDGIISLRDYHKQMQIYQYLHQLYPQVHISLHAGELTQEIAAPEALNFHIHDALLTGQAERIGHGVAIAHENEAKATLDYMVKQHKVVEINLISNLRILSVAGKEHPLNYYLAHHVPVVLSTDDEGILRTDLTAQYVEAVISHAVDYQTLKQINRNALTYAFLPGKSIWADADKALLIQDCQDLNSASCKEFIKTNAKAQLQWNLEQKLRVFEGRY